MSMVHYIIASQIPIPIRFVTIHGLYSFFRIINCYFQISGYFIANAGAKNVYLFVTLTNLRSSLNLLMILAELPLMLSPPQRLNIRAS